jgi:hypothetical protein
MAKSERRGTTLVESRIPKISQPKGFNAALKGHDFSRAGKKTHAANQGFEL